MRAVGCRRNCRVVGRIVSVVPRSTSKVQTSTSTLRTWSPREFVAPRPFADPEVAPRKLVELANAFEPIQDGRIYIEKINGPFLFRPQRHAGGVQGRARSCDCQGLASAARERHLCPLHRGGRRIVRLKAAMF
jgi:hypothetical protein